MMEYTKVALDAMGGDNAPACNVGGAIQAINECDRLQVYLVGREAEVRTALSDATVTGGVSYDSKRIIVVDASEVIENAEAPVMAIRKKKDSSIVKAMNMVKEGQCDAYVSAGSTGATLVGGQVIVGRIKGVERSPLAPLIPTKDGVALIVDCGANVDARPSMLVQFAKMGSIYMESIMGMKNPRVAIVNIGAEEEKGNALVKETFPLLKACPDINFIGSIEAREIPEGGADVIVCDAFVGNVIIKLIEGTGKVLLSKMKESMFSDLRSKIGALLLKPALKSTLKKFDASEYGGAPMLGLNGLVVKTHGSSTSKEIKNTLIQCVQFKEQNISDKIKRVIAD
ncbi:MAG: phosphate acyltransferase PlsX [Lachnospiraceae bacterium]|nr:phosphate acyltransferase PlsX [Lachnospiraceae bacterium]